MVHGGLLHFIQQEMAGESTLRFDQPVIGWRRWRQSARTLCRLAASCPAHLPKSPMGMQPRDHLRTICDASCLHHIAEATDCLDASLPGLAATASLTSVAASAFAFMHKYIGSPTTSSKPMMATTIAALMKPIV